MTKLYSERSAQRIREMGGLLIPDNTLTDVIRWSIPFNDAFPGWKNLYHSLTSTDWTSLLGALAMVTPGYSSRLKRFGDLRDRGATIGNTTVSEIRYQRLRFLQQAIA